jgi:hypothetical protein
VDSKTFGDLENYYRQCQDLKDIRPESSNDHESRMQKRKDAKGKMEALLKQTVTANNSMQKYIRGS